MGAPETTRIGFSNRILGDSNGLRYTRQPRCINRASPSRRGGDFRAGGGYTSVTDFVSLQSHQSEGFPSTNRVPIRDHYPAAATLGTDVLTVGRLQRDVTVAAVDEGEGLPRADGVPIGDHFPAAAALGTDAHLVCRTPAARRDRLPRSIRVKVSHGPMALRFATTSRPPLPSAQAYWPLLARSATFLISSLAVDPSFNDDAGGLVVEVRQGGRVGSEHLRRAIEPGVLV